MMIKFLSYCIIFTTLLACDLLKQPLSLFQGDKIENQVPCHSDEDCVLVDSNCCSCNNGGKIYSYFIDLYKYLILKTYKLAVLLPKCVRHGIVVVNLKPSVKTLNVLQSLRNCQKNKLDILKRRFHAISNETIPER